MKGKRASIIKQPVKSCHLYVYVEGGGGEGEGEVCAACLVLTNRYNKIQDLECIIHQNYFR